VLACVQLCNCLCVSICVQVCRFVCILFSYTLVGAHGSSCYSLCVLILEYHCMHAFNDFDPCTIAHPNQCLRPVNQTLLSSLTK